MKQKKKKFRVILAALLSATILASAAATTVVMATTGSNDTAIVAEEGTEGEGSGETTTTLPAVDTTEFQNDVDCLATINWTAGLLIANETTYQTLKGDISASEDYFYAKGEESNWIYYVQENGDTAGDGSPVQGLENLVVTVTDVYYDDVTGYLWYKVAAADGHAFPEELSERPWVLQDQFMEFEDGVFEWWGASLLVFEPGDKLLEYNFNGYRVVATGANLPEGGTLIVNEIDAPTDASFQLGVGSYVKYLDISIEYTDDAGTTKKYNGPVTITIPSNAIGLQPDKYFAVVHDADSDSLYEATDELLGPYKTTAGQAGDSTATFTISSLSPFYIADIDDGMVEVYKKGKFKDTPALYSSYSASAVPLDPVPASVPEEFDILYAVTDSNGNVWYWLDVYSWGDDYPTVYCFAKADDVILEGEGDETEDDYALKGTLNDRNIYVYGDIPEGVKMDLKEATTNYGYNDAEVYFDLSLVDGEGKAWQPGTEIHKPVLVSVETDLPDGTLMYVYHKHGHELDTLGGMAHVVIDGRVTFEVDEFSVFVLTGEPNTNTRPTNTQGLTEVKNPHEMIVGQTTYFYASDYYYNGSERYCSWDVVDKNDAIDFEVIERTGNSSIGTNTKNCAPWIKVTAKRATPADELVTLTLKYATGNSSFRTETFYIQVDEKKQDFRIENKVAETGCLVAAWPNGNAPADVTYQWTRKLQNQTDAERTEPCKESLFDNNQRVNISIDHGGLTNTTINNPYTYTVTATGTVNGQTVTYTDSYTVTYGSEILNPSFETPAYPDTVAYVSLPNGTPGLFWQTTAPGTGDKLTQDVEITVNGTRYGGEYNINLYAAEGKQFAEVNAEAFGTLYQDMLTTPGATLTWRFNHAGRRDAGGTANNTLYVVLAATESAQEVVDADTISAMLGDAQEKLQSESKTLADIPSSGEGYKFTHKNTEYVIWRHVAEKEDGNRVANDPDWKQISGTYKVPEGQYLTRFFFASDPNATGNKVLGNLIDNVQAGEKMLYKVEYYHNGQPLTTHTETGMAEVHATVPLKELAAVKSEHSSAIITNVTVNGNPYSGDIENGLHITSYPNAPEDCPIVLKVYLEDRAIVVNKVVTIPGWDEMSDSEKEAVFDNYVADFRLAQNGTDVAKATATINDVTADTIQVRCEFDKTLNNQEFTPSNGTYTIREIKADNLKGYNLVDNDFSVATGITNVTVSGDSILYEDTATVTLSNDNSTAEVTCTNEYQNSTGSLTITKNAENCEEGDTFIFNVTGPNNFNLTVTISGQDIKNGKNSVTINNLPLGEYTVTEDTNWSWRYDTTVNKTGGKVTVDADGEEIIFTNTKDNNQWLDYNTFADNIFAKFSSADGTVSEQG